MVGVTSDFFEIIMFPETRKHFCELTTRGWVGFSMPRKIFLNGTIPALVNINVGSLAGMSDALGTICWPC